MPCGLIELMALKTLQRDAETGYGLEDAFDDRDTSAAKLAWVDGWRKLPHIAPEIQRLYNYPQQFAEEIYNRIAHQLSSSGKRTGRLYIVSGDDPESGPESAAIPELPARYFISSDGELDRAQLLKERQEGHFLVSYETSRGWVALRKDLLSEVLGAGCDARIEGLPLHAVQVLGLMCAGLAIPENLANQPPLASP